MFGGPWLAHGRYRDEVQMLPWSVERAAARGWCRRQGGKMPRRAKSWRDGWIGVLDDGVALVLGHAWCTSGPKQTRVAEIC